MDLNLRKAILANVSDNSKDELEATIVDAIQNGEEKMLPGLGVFFELVWKHSGENEKNSILQLLEQGVQTAGA
ncbi:small acid-soluble spore protein I (minor) [Amphibacillus marinus]|uniref:Small, acid-soluble spore protein I n=1 Tax=Amphibacillus marinus TaxID=872970 RepID=A0A1H8SSW4_9BACI|nr:small acid-soluble spore protein SspI [Amphibacillus marinus]SEO81655.1 small acid-soluble spore protein I (minor) [Amphibacillus marinus]